MDMELLLTFDYVEKIEIYNDGNKTEYVKDSENFCKIMYEWNDMCNEAKQMPAFGVSLDNETKTALKNGVWINFVFDKQYVVDEMPYSALLVKVEKEWQGFNLYRYNSNFGFSGRCFYLNLFSKNMSNLYNLLTNI